MTAVSYPVDASTPAVVLKFDPNVMHHGGLGVIRSLGRIGICVYGVHEGKFAPAANSRYLRGRSFGDPTLPTLTVSWPASRASPRSSAVPRC